MTIGKQHIVVALCVLGAVFAVAACEGNETALPQGSEAVELDPSNFSIEIDNPYWPMSPGNT